MPSPDNKKIDALLLLARATLADRRRRSPFRLLVIVALFVALLALFIWLVRPKPRPPQLMMAAFDQVTLPDRTVQLSAGVEPIEAGSAEADLSGCLLYFEERKTGLLAKEATGQSGTALVPCTFPAGGEKVEVMVRYPGDQDRRRGAEAKARVFVWPAETRMLIVDADHALADIDEAKLWTTSNLDIRPLPGAAATLRTARAKYHIVYLTAAADRPSRYSKLRAWLEQFPDGPLLARAGATTETDAAAYKRHALDGLKERFRAPMVGIVKRVEDAHIFRDAGLQSFLVGENVKVPEGIGVAKSWEELAKPLAK